MNQTLISVQHLITCSIYISTQKSSYIANNKALSVNKSLVHTTDVMVHTLHTGNKRIGNMDRAWKSTTHVVQHSHSYTVRYIDPCLVLKSLIVTTLTFITFKSNPTDSSYAPPGHYYMEWVRWAGTLWSVIDLITDIILSDYVTKSLVTLNQYQNKPFSFYQTELHIFIAGIP